MPPKPPPNQPNSKRKAPNQPPNTTQQQKRPRFNIQKDARTLLTQPASAAFSNGELDVDRFVKSREFEIKALEKGMKDAKGARSRRAFQDVPRELRRRTAAHDVKRVPKRLRDRASREMREDNTPTVHGRKGWKGMTPRMRVRMDVVQKLKKINRNTKLKKKKERGKEGDRNVEVTITKDQPESRETAPPTGQIVTRKPKPKKSMLKNPPVPASKFRKRQTHKSWLPTHMFHTKRAHMTPPAAPLWRFAIPLSPTQKSYRPTHRVSQTRGAVAWDTSYVSTIGLSGTEKSLRGLLEALGVGKDDGALWEEQRYGKRWRAGTRIWDGWVFERDGYPGNAIAPVTVIWCAKESTKEEDITMEGVDETARPVKKEKRQVIIRVHPSAFLQLWEEILKLAKMQHPAVSVEDLRFEISSIEITGPDSTEALVGTLHPSTPENKGSEENSDSPANVFKALNSITNLSALPKHILLAFTISDPRLHHPPRLVKNHPHETSASDPSIQKLLVDWPLDRAQSTPALFSRQARLTASRVLPSQKSINRRKSQAESGQHPDPLPSDPRIPILLYLSSCGGSTKWTLLLPWKTVSPVWNSLMYQPLSTGGTPRFGGLEQTRQVCFEAGTPWFPGDYPGTKAGMAWEEMERKKRKEEWEKRPKKRRVAWESLDLGEGRKGEIGLGWACDWEHLFGFRKEEVVATSQDTGQAKKGSEAAEEPGNQTKPANVPKDGQSMSKDQQKEATTCANQSADTDSAEAPIFSYIPSSLALQLLQQPRTSSSLLNLNHALTPIRLTLLTRGVPNPCARIYRLPSSPKLRQTWLSLLPQSKSFQKAEKTQSRRRPVSKADRNTPQALAAMILDPPPQPDSEKYPAVPNADDLIGFLTTGAFNLSEGRGTGIGSLAVSKVLGDEVAQRKATVKVPGHGTVELRQICIVRNSGETVGRLARWDFV